MNYREFLLVMNNGLLEKYEALQEIHHQALHELAEAAQKIKFYDYLEKIYRQENELLENVLVEAEKVCQAADFETFQQRRADLERAIQKFKNLKEQNSVQSAISQKS